MEFLEIEEDKKEIKQEIEEVSSESFTKKSPEIEEITDLFSVFPNLNKEILEDKKVEEEAPRVSKKVVFNVKLMEGILDDLLPTFNEFYYSKNREEIPAIINGQLNIFSGDLDGIKEAIRSGFKPLESQVKIVNEYASLKRYNNAVNLEIKDSKFFLSARVDSIDDLDRLSALSRFSFINTTSLSERAALEDIVNDYFTFDRLIGNIYNIINNKEI